MKAQRFTVSIKRTSERGSGEPFTVEEIEKALRAAFPGTFDERWGTHSFSVKEATR